MPIAFGFSTGDFIAVIGLVIKICQAFDDNSNALKEFAAVRSELESFGDLVTQLQESILRGTAISEQNAAKVKNVFDSCKQALESFQSFLNSYKDANSIRRRVSWTVYGKKKIEPFRQRIQRNITILGLVQHELTM